MTDKVREAAEEARDILARVIQYVRHKIPTATVTSMSVAQEKLHAALAEPADDGWKEADRFILGPNQVYSIGFVKVPLGYELHQLDSGNWMYDVDAGMWRRNHEYKILRRPLPPPPGGER